MSFPPVPSLPSASELRKYSSSPPDFMSPIRRYHKGEKAQDLVYDAWEANTREEKFAILRRALQIFPFSVDALACWADLYVRYNDIPKDYHTTKPKKRTNWLYARLATCGPT